MIKAKQSDNLIELEMLNSYTQQALKTEVVGLVTGLIMAAYFWGEVNEFYLGSWLAILISGPFLHHFLIHQFQHHKLTVQHTLLWLKFFWFASGGLWGAFVLICLDAHNAVNVAILTGLAAGMLAGAAPGASMLRHVYILFAAPLCFLYSLSMLTATGVNLDIMGLLGFIMFGLMFMLSQQLYTEFKQSIALRFENVELLEMLQKTNIDKTRFLAAASHDLRQPHQALGLFLESLDFLENEPKKKDIIYKTKQAFHAMSGLLDQLLDISRLDSGAIKAHMEVIPLQPLLHQITMEYMGQAEKHNLELRLRSTDAVVYADPMILHRILSNLLSNALRYTKKGGVLIGVRKHYQDWVLKVYDTGQGIPAAKQEFVFQEFTQLDNTPQRDREKGLGLGLAIVRRLSLMMNANISVDSVVNQGTCFSLILQAADEQEEQVTPSIPLNLEGSSLNGLIVVVVDDDENSREGLVTLLSVWGCQVHAFACESTCMQGLSEVDWLPDALIVDFQLQGKHTGNEVIQDIHKICERQVPSLILTGDATPERIKDTERHGFPLLHKPVAPEKLRLFLEKV